MIVFCHAYFIAFFVDCFFPWVWCKYQPQTSQNPKSPMKVSGLLIIYFCVPFFFWVTFPERFHERLFQLWSLEKVCEWYLRHKGLRELLYGGLDALDWATAALGVAIVFALVFRGVGVQKGTTWKKDFFLLKKNT